MIRTYTISPILNIKDNSTINPYHYYDDINNNDNNSINPIQNFYEKEINP